MPQKIVRGSRKTTGKSPWTSQVEGLDEILANVARVIDHATGVKAKKVYYGAGATLRDEARRRAPFKSGRLRSKIFVGWGTENKPDVLVGVTYGPGGAPHAHLLEFGRYGKGIGARPYFRPAIAATSPILAQMIKDGLGKLIEKAATEGI